MTNASNLFNNFEPLDIAEGKLKNTKQLSAYGGQIAAGLAGEINANDTDLPSLITARAVSTLVRYVDAGPHDGLNRGWS